MYNEIGDDMLKYFIIAAILIVILLAVMKATQKDAGLDFNKLVELLGGKKNIILLLRTMQMETGRYMSGKRIPYQGFWQQKKS